MPFGCGPRHCVGMRFALTNAKACLAHVISNFKIQRCSETKAAKLSVIFHYIQHLWKSCG
ncbi:unnamed protein product, partial [Larinioides sclopetarius]